ncbi:ribonuclease P protein component [Tsukamurella soli]|uniref:ribonuclease P protein component n=1 Tax=Tsukamurella soli TaxID=644556 RepID=UPI0036080E9A
MLPARYRMSSSRDFTAAVKGGRRAGRTALVVHLALGPGSPDPATAAAGPGRVVSAAHRGEPTGAPAAPVVGDPARWGGPRVGLVVSKAVGNAVTRHAVARRLRAAAGTVVAEIEPSSLIVIRALRPAADTDSSELAAQLRSGLRKLGAL